MLKVWQHVAQQQDDEPSPWLKAMGEAHQREAAFDWAGAEEAYKRLLMRQTSSLCFKAELLPNLLLYIVIIQRFMISNK